MNEIIGDHQCWFRRNRSSGDQIFCIRHIPKIEWKYNEIVHQVFIDFKEGLDSVREVLHNIVIEIGVIVNLVRLIKM
jgi:hypothetical protein